MKDRISRIMQEEKMNAAQFSDAIGVQRAAMSHILTGRNNPSLDVVTKILNRFPSINPDWLIHGKNEARRIPFGAKTNVKATDIFANDTPKAASNSRTETIDANNVINNITEIQPKEPYKQAENSIKEIEKEVVIYKESPAKTIDKLLIFYSDNTYESFIPEKKR